MLKVAYPRYRWPYLALGVPSRVLPQTKVIFYAAKQPHVPRVRLTRRNAKPPKVIAAPPVFTHSRIPHRREELSLKTGCWLYKYESSSGELLYVGVTDNLCGRIYQHMVSAWGHPAFGNKVFAAKFDNMRSARAVESFYLINHKPKLYLSPEKMTLGVPLGFEIPPVVFEEITHLIYVHSP